MASSKPPCPEGLQPIVQHADRFARVLREMERARTNDKWFIGRSAELRGSVRFAIDDVYTSADIPRARRKLADHLEHLHRQVARRVGYEALTCCEPDEVITVPRTRDDPEVDHDSDVFPTEESPFEDSPEVMARFEEQLKLERVEKEVAIFAHRVGTRDATRDDLHGFAMEGLHDAARSFDERHGVPFEAWARQRMRHKMYDGARMLRGIPRSVLQQQGALQGIDAASVTDGDRFEPVPHQSDEDVEQAFSALELSPEEIVAERELCGVVHANLAELPKSERAVFKGYYFEERNLKEVGASQGHSESWASRKLARATRIIRSILEGSGSVRTDPEDSAP
jgi:RNA polymerase sigma factor FliA